MKLKKNLGKLAKKPRRPNLISLNFFFMLPKQASRFYLVDLNILALRTTIEQVFLVKFFEVFASLLHILR